MEISIFDQPLMEFVYSGLLIEVLEDGEVVDCIHWISEVCPNFDGLAEPSQEITQSKIRTFSSSIE